MNNKEKPILITLTGGTCSGKNFICNKIEEKLNFNRIVSTTSRPKRSDEIEGVDYYFVEPGQISNLTFLEHITYGNYTYGVQLNEIENKISIETPAVVILTPTRVEHYLQYCKQHQITLVQFFINTPANLCKERLIQRTLNDLNNPGISQTTVISDLIDRCQKIHKDEMYWHPNHNAIVLDGTDIEWALESVAFFVKKANRCLQSSITVL